MLITIKIANNIKYFFRLLFLHLNELASFFFLRKTYILLLVYHSSVIFFSSKPLLLNRVVPSTIVYGFHRGVDYLDMNTKKRYQANLWGMYPSLSKDDAWTALEKDGQILVSTTTGKELQILGEGSRISSTAAGRFLGGTPVQVTTTSQPEKLLISKQIGPQGGTVEVAGKIQHQHSGRCH